MRNPATDPRAGDVVHSEAWSPFVTRRVIHRVGNDVWYQQTQGLSTTEARLCLLVTWRRWCRKFAVATKD
jgi:hypothetical protein